MLKKTLLLSSTFMMVAAAPAMAQVEDEIIVTATKRAQTLQEVPVAVTVTSSDVIEKAQILCSSLRNRVHMRCWGQSR